MTKISEKKIQEVAGLQEEMSSLAVDTIEELAPKAVVPEVLEMSIKERAKKENVRYIEPKRTLTPPGKAEKLPEKLKKQHARDWEYVKGILENFELTGEPVEFALKLYPGDPDLLWEVPSNVPVYVPRLVAKHLEETMKYHTFSFIDVPSERWKVNDFTHHFKPTGTHYRAKFRSVGAFE
jgi:hypothetical protein